MILSRTGKWLVIMGSLVILLLGAYFWYQFVNDAQTIKPSTINNDTAKRQSAEPSAQPTTKTAPPIETIPLFGDANYQSENFRVGDIAIGGEAEFLLVEDSPEPIAISAIRGEAFTEKNKQEVKLVLSWKTNKLAQSTISYSKGFDQAKKTVDEDEYSLNHSVIIPGLDQASTYVYVIASTDRFGNETTSDSYAIYTGAKTLSLFDLIAGAIGEVFGWAIKK